MKFLTLVMSIMRWVLSGLIPSLLHSREPKYIFIYSIKINTIISHLNCKDIIIHTEHSQQKHAKGHTDTPFIVMSL